MFSVKFVSLGSCCCHLASPSIVTRSLALGYFVKSILKHFVKTVWVRVSSSFCLQHGGPKLGMWCCFVSCMSPSMHTKSSFLAKTIEQRWTGKGNCLRCCYPGSPLCVSARFKPLSAGKCWEDLKWKVEVLLAACQSIFSERWSSACLSSIDDQGCWRWGRVARVAGVARAALCKAIRTRTRALKNNFRMGRACSKVTACQYLSIRFSKCT